MFITSDELLCSSAFSYVKYSKYTVKIIRSTYVRVTDMHRIVLFLCHDMCLLCICIMIIVHIV